MKKILAFSRYAVSLGLIALLFVFVDTGRTWEVLRTASLPLVGAAVAAYLAAFPVMAYRWLLLLRVNDVDLPFPTLVRYYLVGFFFNNFLPTSIGGDVVRVFSSARDSGKRPACLAAVMIERIIGLLAIVSLAIGGTAYAAGRLDNDALMWASFALGSVVAAGLAVLLNERGLRLLERRTAGIRRFGIGRRTAKLCTVFRLFRGRPGTLVAVFAVSVAYQCVMVLFTWLLSLAVGLGTAFSDFFVCVPVVAVLGLLPSVNGLGVREGGYVYLLTRLGSAGGGMVERPAALSFALLVLVVGMAGSVPGGLLFMVKRNGTVAGSAEALRRE